MRIRPTDPGVAVGHGVAVAASNGVSVADGRVRMHSESNRARTMSVITGLESTLDTTAGQDGGSRRRLMSQ